MDGRYEVFATHGKGVFSTVLRARDGKYSADEKGKSNPAVRTTFPEVAIKVIRANDIMSKAGQAEVVILRKLAGADPTSKYHIIRLLRTFEYRHHLCLVFEPLVRSLPLPLDPQGWETPSWAVVKEMRSDFVSTRGGCALDPSSLSLSAGFTKLVVGRLWGLQTVSPGALEHNRSV